MTQLEITKAHNALERLTELSLPVGKARAVYLMNKKSDELFQFAVAEERKYVADSDGTLSEDGSLSFKTEEGLKSFKDKLAELNASEVEWDFKPIKITESEMGSQRITPADIAALEGFVVFDE